ncbi:uncharacterized protein LOC120335398 [Styela clava]
MLNCCFQTSLIGCRKAFVRHIELKSGSDSRNTNRIPHCANFSHALCHVFAAMHPRQITVACCRNVNHKTSQTRTNIAKTEQLSSKSQVVLKISFEEIVRAEIDTMNKRKSIEI